MNRVILATALALVALPSFASDLPAKSRCVPWPQCSGGYNPGPAPTPGSPSENQSVIQALIEVQQEFVADVNAADQVATTTWGTPPTMIDPIAHACYPVLSAWAAGLSLPVLPDVGSGGGLVTAFERTRVAAIIAAATAQQISTFGFPATLQVACGGLIVNTIQSAAGMITQIASFDILLARFIPKPMLEKHHLQYLIEGSKP